MRDFLVAGNWKMNGSSAANAELIGSLKDKIQVSGNLLSTGSTWDADAES